MQRFKFRFRILMSFHRPAVSLVCFKLRWFCRTIEAVHFGALARPIATLHTPGSAQFTLLNKRIRVYFPGINQNPAFQGSGPHTHHV